MKEAQGTLVDIGARDRILKSYLPDTIDYKSADLSDGHDYQWDLEKPIDCEDGSFDFVTCLDVLEHVEQVHEVLKELLRIAKKEVYISFPNMGFLPFRVNFLLKGKISGKYSLLPEHQGDRHRWLTIYDQITNFVKSNCDSRWELEQYNLLNSFTRFEKFVTYLPLPAALKTYTVLYKISKKNS